MQSWTRLHGQQGLDVDILKGIIQPKMTLLKIREHLRSIPVSQIWVMIFGISFLLKHMEVGLVPSRLGVNWLDL